MIAKAKSISHGINDINYITGESRNKKHPEKISHVANNLLDESLNAEGIWESMKLTAARHPKVKNNVIRIELSPAKEHTLHFTMEDWKQLWRDFIEEYDRQEIYDRKGRLVSQKTNLAGSKGSVWLHLESAGGIPHLHGAVCRIDSDGNINNDHQIHLRAQRAAERVARKRGWTTAAEVRETSIGQVNRDCMEALQSMDSWSWNGYAAILHAKGYEIWVLRDSKDKLRGYVLKKGNSKYKASELGIGRNLMVTKLENTWKKLHAGDKTVISTQTKTRKPQGWQTPKPVPFVDYSAYRYGTTSYNLTDNGKEYRFHIPNDVLQLFNDEFDHREVANHKDLTDMAVALFVGMMEAPTVPSGGGGGTSNDLPWGRKEDEDDLRWARRCAMMATRMMGRKPKSGYKR